MNDLDHFLAQWQHPIMAAVHPWLVGAFWMLVAVTVVMAVRTWLAWEERDKLSAALITLAATVAVGLLTLALNPYIPADRRFTAWCLLSLFPLGFLAIRERLNDWDFKPFGFLCCIPPAIIAVQFAIASLKAAMTIPPHIESWAQYLVALLNHVSEPTKSALIIAAVLLALFRELVKFLKSLVTR